MRHVKTTYPTAYITSFAATNFQELRNRTSMIASTQVSLPLSPLPSSLRVRQMTLADRDHISTLLQRAYNGGPDNLHPDLAGWRAEARAVLEVRFGPFIPECR